MKNLHSEHPSTFPDLPPALERRQRERIALNMPLRIVSYGALVDKSNTGTCTDLSEGGVAFNCEAELNVGEVVILEFHQRGEAAYRCHARLAYRMGARYGAYFLPDDGV
jgi:PilZ domain-containing protein